MPNDSRYSGKTKFLIFTLVGIGVIVGAYVFFAISKQSVEYVADGQVLYDVAIANWSKIISDRGVYDATREAIRVGNSISENEAHTLMHSFGEALYQEFGEKGISYCMSDFATGCYNQIVANVIIGKGIASADELKQICGANQNVRGCAHGIGHGLLASMGHSIDDLHSALSFCGTSDEVVQTGCGGGVIMEYNVRGLHSSTPQEDRIRKFDPKHPFDPCFTVDERYVRVCVYLLPHWWYLSLQNSSDDVFMEIGHYCRELDLKSDVRKSCFKGVGYYGLQFADMDVSQTVQNCKKAAAEPEDLFWCISTASKRSTEEGQDAPDAFCSAFGPYGDARDTCIRRIQELP